jgi:hypothetical protein
MATDIRFEYNFKEAAFQNTTWGGASCTLRLNGTTPPSAITAISTTFTNTVTGKEYTLTSATGGGITIVSGAAGTYNYNKQILAWCAGEYFYSTTFTFANGDVKEYAKGTLIVKEKNDA